MNRFRLIATFFVISIGLAISYLIISKPSGFLSEADSVIVSDNSFKENNGLWSQINPIKWVENPANQPARTDSSLNATDIFSKSLFEKMKGLDREGKNPFEKFDLSDSMNKKFVDDIMKDLNRGVLSFEQTVKDSDLKISQDNSRGAKAKYLEAIALITQKRFNDPKYKRSTDQIINDIENDCLGKGHSLNKEMAQLYQNLASDYLNLLTPSDYLSLHKSIIMYFKKSQNVYSALANCFDDPIKGYAAAQTLPELITNAQQIQVSLTRKSNEVD